MSKKEILIKHINRLHEEFPNEYKKLPPVDEIAAMPEFSTMLDAMEEYAEMATIRERRGLYVVIIILVFGLSILLSSCSKTYYGNNRPGHGCPTSINGQ